MTEHRKIPLPGEEPPKKDSSLLERAGGAFGLDGLKPAPISGKLEERPMKRARQRQRGPEDATTTPERVEAELVRDEPIEQPAEAAAPEPEQPKVPATVPPPPAIVTRFEGERQQVDRERLRAEALIDPDAGTSALLEEFRIVKRQLLAAARARGDAAARRVLVSSPHQGEGKTFCAINLAIAMAAERDSEVLLVDADFARPSVVDRLGLSAERGFMDLLADDGASVEDLVIGTDIPGLWVLPAGEQRSGDSEYLASDATAGLLERLTAGNPNRVVIFDSPPALAASPAAELAKHCGQTVLVARADQTGQSALEDAYQLLSACPDIKLLLNAANFSPSGRRFGAYGNRE